MLKLPEKKYEPKHNDELRAYAKGWNLIVDYVDVYEKEFLVTKKIAYKKLTDPYFKGQYDCIVEIERLNEEPEHRLDNFFQDSLDALDKLNIRGE